MLEIMPGTIRGDYVLNISKGATIWIAGYKNRLEYTYFNQRRSLPDILAELLIWLKKGQDITDGPNQK
jgi:hypothetical protein